LVTGSPIVAEDLTALLSLAVALAREAGALLLTQTGDVAVETKSSPSDVVTSMDRRVETLLVERIRAARPGDGISAEEGSGTEQAGSVVRWYVDPIDGSVNYLRGLPHYSVSLAVEVDGDVCVGVVFDPSADELFSAVADHGATRNGAPIACSQTTDVAAALVGTGFSYVSARRVRQAQTLTRVLPAVADIRRPGSAAVSTCWVACGRLDAFYEHGLEKWDFAAGALIAREAGAVVERTTGDRDRPPLLLVAAPGIADALADLVAQD
jgi:myo-inositol-1(or 4)-monophosphatase